MMRKEKPTGAGTTAGSNQTSTAIVAEGGAGRKAFATIKARAAIRGHTLVKVVDGYIVAKGAHSRHCNDLATVDALLRRMGA